MWWKRFIGRVLTLVAYIPFTLCALSILLGMGFGWLANHLADWGEAMEKGPVTPSKSPSANNS